MKVSLNWLNRYLGSACDASRAEAVLTHQGFPLDGCEAVALAGGGSDMQLDVEITSNRSDCLSHVGLAREVAAGGGGAFNPPTIALPQQRQAEDVAQLTRVDNDDHELCPLYTARVIRDVTIGPSPQWLVDALEAVGLRSVNNVVDVTNFVLLELGQPLHAFDMDTLAEGRIVVRCATQGEPFVAIDGTKHDLTSDMLVIADAQKPVAVAGVMGGLHTEVTQRTTNILLESAIFAPLSVRRTSRRLKLFSDSSFRFERGVDPLGVDRASQRAAQLIVELAGGTPAGGVIRVGRDDPSPRQVTMRTQRCRDLLGMAIDDAKQTAYLEKLGLSPTPDDGRITCTIPTFRLDLHREVDLIEEVARLHGLANVPMQEKIHIVAHSPQPQVNARRLLMNVMLAHGYHETITFSFTREKLGEPFVPQGGQAVLVEDERRKADPMLRPSLLPSLLSCRKSNQDAGNKQVRLYETASAWHRRDEKIHEQEQLVMISDAEQPDEALRDLRGTVAELVQRLGGDDACEQLMFEPMDHPCCRVAAKVSLGSQVLGWIGLLSQAVRELFDLQVNVVAGELDLPTLIGMYPPVRKVAALPRFPGIERDLSVIVDEAVTWQTIEQTVQSTQPALMEQMHFITAYRGKPISKGRKSVSFRMRFRDPATTLRHEQVDPQVQSVVEALQREVNAELRG